MSLTLNKSAQGNGCEVVLSEDMSIYAISELKTEIDSLIEPYQRVIIDLSNVEEFDSSGVQLLLSLKKTLLTNAKTFSTKDMSPEVVKLLDVYGLTQALRAEGI